MNNQKQIMFMKSAFPFYNFSLSSVIDFFGCKNILNAHPFVKCIRETVLRHYQYIFAKTK